MFIFNLLTRKLVFNQHLALFPNQLQKVVHKRGTEQFEKCFSFLSEMQHFWEEKPLIGAVANAARNYYFLVKAKKIFEPWGRGGVGGGAGPPAPAASFCGRTHYKNLDAVTLGNSSDNKIQAADGEKFAPHHQCLLHFVHVNVKLV